MFRADENFLKIFFLQIRNLVSGLAQNDTGKTNDRVHGVRRSWLTLARKCQLVAIGDLELAAFLLDLSKQPRILDGQDRLGSEGLKQVNDLSGKVTHSLLIQYH